MAYTVELLALIEAFPDAFLEPEQNPKPSRSLMTREEDLDDHGDLLALIREFPAAFQDPKDVERGQSASAQSASAQSASAQSASVQSPSTQSPSAQSPSAQSPRDKTAIADLTEESAHLAAAPPGYGLALHRQISTLGWGQIEVFLNYGSSGLRSIWMTVGKSGTEVQSLCEAIARLVNLLLEQRVPASEIVRQIRGIRGGDSEGLGPHRFLGLADLIGKVLQEAPQQGPNPLGEVSRGNASNPEASSHPIVDLPPVAGVSAESPVSPPPQVATVPPVSPPTAGDSLGLMLLDNSALASLCPDCGAELQQVNGCSGGACVVCGYSSCS
ncbi:TSCPD domain-containing protein [Lyngbya confervoides]|uniref:ribonucleoside-diphosphate reductase n=1 Tax=Lyngbya confervoides BDU141951 TaxID=1574623 RepID=A0ABD4T4N2_9CYAN|nr:ribonucleotide reductase [Lyngbya confervoides]MCM1983415.1 hypothetical protein [Lyngbya confervoides BDU141951]